LLLRCCDCCAPMEKRMRRDGGGGFGWWQLLQRHAMPFLSALRAFCAAQIRFVDLVKGSCWRRREDGGQKLRVEQRGRSWQGMMQRCNFLNFNWRPRHRKGISSDIPTPGCHLDPCQVMQAGSGVACAAADPRRKQLKHAATHSTDVIRRIRTSTSRRPSQQQQESEVITEVL
jgi:hypothetical protein